MGRVAGSQKAKNASRSAASVTSWGCHERGYELGVGERLGQRHGCVGWLLHAAGLGCGWEVGRTGSTWSGAVPLPTMGVRGSMAMSMRLRPCPSCPTTPSF